MRFMPIKRGNYCSVSKRYTPFPPWPFGSARASIRIVRDQSRISLCSGSMLRKYYRRQPTPRAGSAKFSTPAERHPFGVPI